MQFSSTKNYLAYHNKKYQVIIYKLNLVTEKNIMIRLIEGSQNCPLHSLIWDNDCSKVFCGYSNGIVDVIYVPQNTKDYFHIPSEGLLRLEKQDIVQLDSLKDLLLVSTNEKVILINIQSKFMTFIGTKPRSGQYGACFWYDSAKQLRIVSARPGYRLWIALVDGTVEETQQYKTWNNSLKFKISDTNLNSTGNGQYSALSIVRNTNLLVAVENGGPLFIIDLIKKSCITVVDYGSSLTTIVCDSDRILFNSQREVVCLAITTFKDALFTILDEDIDVKYAIDLFLNVMNKSDDTEFTNDARQISYSLSPQLLSRLVQKSAEISYRFSETNKLQVSIQDNKEYQGIFSSKRLTDSGSSKLTSSPIENFPDDGSMESDCSNDLTKRNQRNQKRPEKRKGFAKTPQLLQTIYDKTSNFLANIDVLSSSNSDAPPNIVDSYSELMLPAERDPMEYDTIQGAADNMPEDFVSNINLMELEANGYIASEKLKQRHVDADSRNDFLESLSNFCETWLILNIRHWEKLCNFELYVRNLSATFLVLNTKISVSSNDSFQPVAEDNFVQEQINSRYANSWTSTIAVNDWMKPIPIPNKIYQMTSNLLSECFFQESFAKFLDLICRISDLTARFDCFQGVECTILGSTNDYYENVCDKQIQATVLGCHGDVVTRVHDHRRGALLDILTEEVWYSESADTSWITAIIKHFHQFLNTKTIRQWVRSGISHDLWTVTMDNFRDVCLFVTVRDQNLWERSLADLEKMLFDSLCSDTIYSFVVVDEILSIMKEMDVINWSMLIESENLDCRDILHLSLKYDLDLTDYVLQLFNYVNRSIKFSARYSLLEHIYSQSDVIISFIYSLLLNRSSDESSSLVCECGLLITYSEVILPENVHALTIEILKWGADHGVFKNDSKLLNVLMKLCLDAGYQQGYIELLVGMSRVSDLVKIGVQVANMDILDRLQDCVLGSVMDTVDLIIDSRRKQARSKCLACGRSICSQAQPLPWAEIGRLILGPVAEGHSYLDMVHSVLPKLCAQELDEMRALLVDSVGAVLGGDRESVDRDEMASFIRAEMAAEESGADITEKYLDVYTMSRQQLAGLNWGRIVTGNMVCDLCGSRLLSQAADDSDGVAKDIVAYCCSHTFHRLCCQQMGYEGDLCFLC